MSTDRSTAETYRRFADDVRGLSPCFERWSLAVADDPQAIARIDELPKAKRQPNLVFAAARWIGAPPGPYAGLREVLLSRWDEVRAVAAVRSTQTNEPGRCATLLPLLAALPQPLALIEVGASAGLCLVPDRYSYRYGDGTRLDPIDDPSPVALDCDVRGAVPVPTAIPEVVWRAGIDLSPIDLADDDQVAWLQNLIWPEHDRRRDRLRAAVELVRADRPRILTGDLNDELPALARQAPADATLVVFHTAVLMYLSTKDRQRFVATVSSLPGHWVSNESPKVLPAVAATAARPSTYDTELFLLGLDGVAKAWSHPHGERLDWL